MLISSMSTLAHAWYVIHAFCDPQNMCALTRVGVIIVLAGWEVRIVGDFDQGLENAV